VTVYERIEAMRRLGVQLVVCEECGASMRKPRDDGPGVFWHAHGRGRHHDTVPYYVCSSGCRDRLRAALKAGKRP